ncbi:transcription factor MYB118-like [Vicia villosa]|uniref:transcription factor MYB118-like n=1 Tax=Vicia villosa TaxID=3911 RepID=UPI00273BAB89|nr:transcription factor MYB118-like [Vicia villosa]
METAPKLKEDQRLDLGDNKHKGKWTEDEDWLLGEFVDLFGLQNWFYIATLIEGKTNKQCWNRWHNHVRPDIEKGPWSKEEDMTLIKAHKEVGNKWTEIAKRLPRRTENTVRNHWNNTKKRLYSKKAQNERKEDLNEDLLLNYIKGIILVQESENESNVENDIGVDCVMNKSSESDFNFKGWDSQEEDEVGSYVLWDSQEL